jgi:hypothetical protein
MRARLLKPDFWTDEDLVELPFEYRLLFAGLWNLADREGRLEDRPKRIKLLLFPVDDIDVDRGLTALAGAEKIVRYRAADGQQVVWIPGFTRHQHCHIKEPASKLPPYQPGASPVQAPDKPGARPTVTNTEADTDTDTPPTPQGARPKKSKIEDGAEYLDLLPASHREDPVLRAWWFKWAAHNREKKKPLTQGRAEAHAKKLAAVSVEVAAAMIETAIDRGWQSVFPPKATEGPTDDLDDWSQQ